MQRDSVTIELKYPVESGKEKISSVTMRPAKVRDLKAVDGIPGDVAKTAALIVNLAELTPEQLDEIDGGDFSKLSEAVAVFLA